MGNLGQAMPKVFALFTAGAMASLALPGMSGFVSEIAVFVGFSNSDIYSSSFRTAMIFLSAVGLILTPIYLLSMLRQLFYGTEAANACVVGGEGSQENNNEQAACFGNNCSLPSEAQFNDAQPREIFIAACFLVLIIGVGLYPKMATGMYDATTVAVNAQVRQSYTQIAHNNSNIYAQELKLPQAEIASIEGIAK